MGLVTPNTLYPRKKVISNQYFKVIYLDLNIDYGDNSKQLIVENIDAITSKIVNLISTMPGDDCFEPNFGCNILDLLFSNISSVNAWKAMNYSYAAFQEFIPEINLDKQASNITILSGTPGYFVQYVYSVTGIASGQITTGLNLTQ